MVAMHQLGPPGDPDHQPGGDDHRHEEGEDHRRRGIGRDRRHVGAHHARDEEHRQQRGDHSQRGHDGRVADLAHRVNRGLSAAAPVLHRPVPRDVFDDHNGVIHQNADGKDQREQGHPVQREAPGPTGEQGGRQRQDDSSPDDGRFAPAQRQPDQSDNGARGKYQFVNQLAGFVVGGLPIVTRNCVRSPKIDQPKDLMRV